MNKKKGFLALLATGIIISTFGILIRLLNQDLTPYQQLFFRYTLGFILAFSVALCTKAKWQIHTMNKRDLILNCACSALSVLFFTLSILQTKVTVTISSLYIGSLTTSFLVGTFMFKEKMTPVKWASLFLIFIGILCFVYPFSSSMLSLGLVFGVLSGVLESFTFMFRKKLGDKISRIALVSLQLAGGAIGSLVFVLFSGQIAISHVSIETGAVTLLFGLFLIAINYLIIVGFSNYDLSIGNIIVSSELVFGPLLAFVFLKEVPTIWEIVGACFIIVAVVLPHISWKKKK
jgi:drug/metabolite transporter (DMT)-like permease